MDQAYIVEDKVEVTPTDLNDIYITAIEGGINYWARVLSRNDDETKCALVDKENENEHWHLTEHVLFVGLERYLKSDIIKKDYTPWPGVGVFLEQMDANDADCIVQLALFEEIRFS
jgi:hypothetical protein